MDNNVYIPNLFSDAELDPLKPVESGPVQCLGMEFENEEARREYFRDELRRKLPELRQIEGFPIGEDEDIIRLSDPPYYTACPNPWLNDFIQQWEEEKKDLTLEGKRSETNFHITEPYAYGIKEQKNNPLYTAHSYHTKVPPEVIMNYYLYYTQPGDIVLDCFGGTGMAGVAANLCGNPLKLKEKFNTKWVEQFGKKPKWGWRNCILGDLSPIASYITYNYCNSISSRDFLNEANRIFNTLEKELSYLYEIADPILGVCKIYYIVWSEVQICPHCGSSFVLWDQAVNISNNTQKDKYPCPSCGCEITKRISEKSTITVFDEVLMKNVTIVEMVPVFVNYEDKKGHRHERELSKQEREFYKDINMPMQLNVPIYKLKEGDKTSDPHRVGIHYTHQFYSKRNLLVLSKMKELIESSQCNERIKGFLRIWFTSSQSRLHMMNRYAAKHHRHVGPLANTLYVSATPTEISPFYFVKSKILDNTFDIKTNKNVINQVASATTLSLPDNSIDYIFTDPPFGANIMYSELNSLLESWIGISTNNTDEAIVNKSQHKALNDYKNLMLKCFKEYYRVLKPGKWITIEFSNTSAAVWNTIQLTLTQAGFIISTVTDLNKGRAGLHGIIGVTAVNQDLAISCYKPSDSLTNKMKDRLNGQENVIDFIEELLQHLPIHIEKNNSSSIVVERNPKILYDRLISYYVQQGWPIPMDAGEFQNMLRNSFIERDGMFFTASQALEYEELRKHTNNFTPMALFISNEAEGIAWLNLRLKDAPKTYQEIQPDWMKDMLPPKKGDRLPELLDILEENFIKDEDGYWRKPDPEKAADLEALRMKRMAKEFALYLEQARKPKAKRMKDCRLEVLRYGFKDCYKRKDYEAIIAVGDHIQESLLLEDEILLQYYDSAAERV